LVPFIFISYGWYRIFRGEKESIKIIWGFSCYLIQNTWRIFGSVIVFLEVRGEFIPVENERLLAHPWQRNGLAEKLVEKLDGFFCFSDCCTSFLHSAFFAYTFCILPRCILYSTFFLDAFYILHFSSMHSAFRKNVSCKKHLLLMQKTFSKNASCKMYLWRMHHVKNIPHWCILHSSLMQKTFYKMHVHNVTCIFNCILLTIQLYTISTPVSIVTDILLLYNNL